MAQNVSMQRGPYGIVLGTVQTTSGQFGPTFRIYRGAPEAGDLLHDQDYPAPANEHASAEEALCDAERLAGEWIAAHPDA